MQRKEERERPRGRSRFSLVVAALLVAGCSGGDAGGREIPVSALPKLVLQPADLPKGFVRFDEGRQSSLDAPAGARASPTRFGRQGGWKARYRRGQPDESGPFIVESRVELFGAAGGAEDDLAALREQLAADVVAVGASGRTHEDPELAEEAVAISTLQGSRSAGFRYVTVGWRDRNVTVLLVVAGRSGGVGLDDALRLAAKHQRRIAAAGSTE